MGGRGWAKETRGCRNTVRLWDAWTRRSIVLSVLAGDLVRRPPTHELFCFFAVAVSTHSPPPAGTCKLQSSLMQSQTDAAMVPQAPCMRHTQLAFPMASDLAKRCKGCMARFMCVTHRSIHPGLQPPNVPNCRCALPSAGPANFQLDWARLRCKTDSMRHVGSNTNPFKPIRPRRHEAANCTCVPVGSLALGLGASNRTPTFFLRGPQKLHGSMDTGRIHRHGSSFGVNSIGQLILSR